LKSERDIYEILQGDFVVKAVWTFHYKNFICFVTEFMMGGDFDNILEIFGRFDENQARFYFAELVLALESIHELGIVHRDLKPGNLLMDSNGHLKLTDFGLSELGLNKLKHDHSSKKRRRKSSYVDSLNEIKSPQQKYREGSPFDVSLRKKIQTTHKKCEEIFKLLEKSGSLSTTHTVKKTLSVVGTPDYMAPEILSGDKEREGNYNDKCMDWWSMGVILYQFLVGIPPFTGDTVEQVFDNIKNRRMEWPPIGKYQI